MSCAISRTRRWNLWQEGEIGRFDRCALRMEGVGRATAPTWSVTRRAEKVLHPPLDIIHFRNSYWFHSRELFDQDLS